MTRKSVARDGTRARTSNGESSEPRTSNGESSEPSESPALAIVIHADGACRGNPGPAGVGVVIESRTGRLLEELTRFLGHATNNIAEYNALILGLEAARRLQAADVTVRMDSQLVVRQVGGSYKVRDEKLRPLHARATQLASGFRHFRIEHVPRAANDAADRLANRAIEEAVWRNGAPDDMVL